MKIWAETERSSKNASTKTIFVKQNNFTISSISGVKLSSAVGSKGYRFEVKNESLYALASLTAYQIKTTQATKQILYYVILHACNIPASRWYQWFNPIHNLFANSISVKVYKVSTPVGIQDNWENESKSKDRYQI